MSFIENIQAEIGKLYKSAPNIHISVKMTHPKITVERGPATIIGVYKNIFQVQENDGLSHRRHTLKYSDILTGQVVIEELNSLTDR